MFVFGKQLGISMPVSESEEEPESEEGKPSDVDETQLNTPHYDDDITCSRSINEKPSVGRTAQPDGMAKPVNSISLDFAIISWCR